MRDALLAWGSQFTRGAQSAPVVGAGARRVVTCGMGGSAVAGEILSCARNDVIVHWDYGIPRGLTADDVVICVSWSGQTEETLSSLEQAHAAGLTVAAVTTGGALGARAAELRIPLVTLPNDPLPPRVNAGLMIGALFQLVGMTEQLPVIDAAALEAPAKDLARAIGDKAPVFYAAYPWRKVAGFFKTVINEDAKRPAWSGSFPSVAHNEIMGWSWGKAPADLIPVLVRASQDRATYGQDLDVLVAILKEMGYTVPTFDLPDRSMLEQTLAGYVAALWTGYHVATAAGVDPASTTWIDEFKRRKAL